jgi:hypothetical protein
MESKHRAENGISGSLLCADVHLFAVLLVLKGDRDIFRVRHVAGKREDSLAPVAEGNVSNVDDFGATGDSACGVFAWAHRVEECHYGELCSDGWGGVARGRRSGTAEFEELPEEFWCDGFLAMGGWIKVFECSEKGLDGGSKDFLVFEVEGAAFETFPKRRSHVACGFAHSARHHWSFKTANKFTVGIPFGVAEAWHEGFGDNCDFLLG